MRARSSVRSCWSWFVVWRRTTRRAWWRTRCWCCCGTWPRARTWRPTSWTRRSPLISRSSTTAARKSAPRFVGCHLHEWMRTQKQAKPSSNLVQRTGGDQRGGCAQLGWRTFMMTCLHWIFGYMRLHTHTFNSSFSGTTQVSRYQKGKNQSGFYWSKRQWVAVASAGPCASQHLAPDRQPHQHATTVCLQARCPSCHPTNSVKALRLDTWCKMVQNRTLCRRCYMCS